MKRLTHPVLKFLSLLVLLLPLPGCTNEYAAEPIEAWVVDAETKQPLEGVIVTANWELEVGNVGGGAPVGQLVVMETITDKKGRFYFTAWGPKKREKGWLLERSPQLLFFKSGYEWEGRQNGFRRKMYKDRIHRSDWHGKTIELESFKGSLEEYAGHLSHLDISLGFAVDYPNECEWKQIPRMIVAMHKQKRIFDEKKVYNHLFAIRRIPERGCGSPEEFFRSYLK